MSKEKDRLSHDRKRGTISNAIDRAHQWLLEPTEKIPVLDLEAVRRNQIQRLIQLGFPKEVGQTEDQYKKSIPKFHEQPKENNGRFDIPLVVDPRIPLKKQLKLANIREIIEIDKITNSTLVPNRPHTIWTHLANRTLNANQSLLNFEKNEVASPLVEVTALYLQHPENFEYRDHGIRVLAPGSRYEHDYMPYMSNEFYLLHVGAYFRSDQKAHISVLTRGKTINQKST